MKVIQDSHLYLCSCLSMFCFRSWFSARITPIRYRFRMLIMCIMVLVCFLGYRIWSSVSSVGKSWIDLSDGS